ncbi:poly(A) polymerase [Roseibium aquae]|uniref:Poly(A) polymerase n=1 Tax=Roseibium aquae TaxID=1323746 RepID=A0A916WUZ7_9HYPH|nr:CCA tRNA nucleotidyltransferase [Roseibium aquae]GGB34800.1 poly(A) polymerase [Roseibium aquae]
MVDPSSAPRLSNAPWLSAPGIQAVFRAVESLGEDIRAVGGAVRNTILECPVADIDLATTARPEAVLAAAEAAGLRSIPTGLDHGTVTIIADGAPYEVTTLRQDVETFGRQAKVVFGRDWRADALRRDFSMNALYADRAGTIHDPLNGLPDCLARRVRFIGDPATRIREDYLRILRFFRIHAAYGKGAFDNDGLLACIRQRDGLRQLSAERIGMEMKRLVAAPGAAEALAVMEDAGLLEITTAGVSRIADFRALRSLDQEAPETRHATLGFAVLSGFVDEDLDRIADRFRLSNAERNRMHGALRAAALMPQTPSGDVPIKTALYRVGREAAIEGVLAAWARARAKGAPPDVDEDFRAVLHAGRTLPIPDFPLKGRDFIEFGLAPGPELGRAMKALEAFWIDSGFDIGRDELLAKLAMSGSASVDT